VATLDRWKRFLQGPGRVVFPKLLLQGRDFDPPLIEGSGEVRFADITSFTFSLRGKPKDPAFTAAQFELQRLNPYDPLARFRLFGTDNDGLEWSLGWAVPRLDATHEEWVLDGSLDGISTDDESSSVADTSSTELLFVIPAQHPLVQLMGHAAPHSAKSAYVTTLLGSELKISYDAADQALSITASHSEELPPTLTENWLGEPLRILFGQLIYPRLVARNLGNRRSYVVVRRTHKVGSTATWSALLGHENIHGVGFSLWPRYEELLHLIVQARGKDGHPNFESNKITRLYEEIIQATVGTRWVWALTLASSIEALVHMLGRVGKPRGGDKEEKARKELVDYIAESNADERLKTSAINAVNRASSVDHLRELVSSNVLSKRQYDAWYELRNSVMHGSLVSPYSTEEEDDKLLALLETLHVLTLEVLRLPASNRERS
jgi:hypothetical protein